MTATSQGAMRARYASIMAPVNLGTGAEATIRLAAGLASRFSARLIGVAAEDIVLPYYGDSVAAMDAILIEDARKAAAEHIEQAETLFRRVAAGGPVLDWRAAVDASRFYVLAQARAADLVVLARSGPDDPDQGRMALSPGDLVMELGRPVLVAPPGVESVSAKRVVIAWKNTREARRAVWDALPLLMQAESVMVLTVGQEAAESGAQDVCAYLAGHHIAARALTRPDSGRTALDEIGAIVRQESADLIVAGAFGHSRLREWIFGGVTRDLLQATPVCCLMSH
ncbi:MAG: universal stress protein [Bosea sp. (in: a-proteobacteria)]